MTDDQYAAILTQHLSLLEQIHTLWVVLIVLVGVGLVALLLMFFAAAWSVTKVNERTDARHKELEAKFMLLIDALLGRIANERS